jgi:hypothetical protein
MAAQIETDRKISLPALEHRRAESPSPSGLPVRLRPHRKRVDDRLDKKCRAVITVSRASI